MIKIRIFHDGKCRRYNSGSQLINHITDMDYQLYPNNETIYEFLKQRGFTGITKVVAFIKADVVEMPIPTHSIL